MADFAETYGEEIYPKFWRKIHERPYRVVKVLQSIYKLGDYSDKMPT